MLRRVFGCLLVCASLACGAVRRVEITNRTDVELNYERISGKVRFAVDPKLAVNRAIADIDLAPRNPQGLVEFSSDLLVLRPKDPQKSNGTALVEISNRGTTSLITRFNANDHFLLERGFTLVWIGWEFDVPNQQGLIKLYAPLLKGITGPVRSEILVNTKSYSESLGDRTMIQYAAAEDGKGTLTVRDSPGGARTTIPPANWRVSGRKLEFPTGFEPGRIYEFIFAAKDPPVAGLGMAAVRDYVSYIKQQGIGPAEELRAAEIKRAMAHGVSQSGRFLRTFLADGFNSDEQGKRVFEGVWAHVAGAARGGFNMRFAQPSRVSYEYSSFFYPNKLPPFATDELLAKARAAGVEPKVFLTNGSHEYWNSGASLVHTTPDGKHDAPIPSTARVYFVAGTSHETRDTDLTDIAQIPSNPMEWRFFERAMVVALNSWITGAGEPPPSRVPSLAKDELVDVAALDFPKIPGVNVPRAAFRPRVLDFGPDFLTKGIPAVEPPRLGPEYPVFVPRLDVNGNETSGIRLPELSVPLGTYTGWNLRDPKTGAPEGLVASTGGMILFPRTRAQKEESGDPRTSIEEQYKDEHEYLSRVETAARGLAREHFVLDSDVPAIVTLARQHWRAWAGPPPIRN